MSALQHTTPAHAISGAQAVVESLLRNGIDCGFGIPSIHNIPIYEALRHAAPFHHWVVRHEQAAGYAADGFYRQSGRIAVVFASTGPGNLFTLVPLLESLQSDTAVMVIGTNIASHLHAGQGGALHETPDQLEIIRPLTRYARRVASAAEIPAVIAEAVSMLRGSCPGPAFIEIPHDLLAATFTSETASPRQMQESAPGDLAMAIHQVQRARRPVLLIGGAAKGSPSAVKDFAEMLQGPVFTTTSGKGNFPGDHPLFMGCISRLGLVQEVLNQSDLLVSLGARFTEFDTGRFQLRLPEEHIQVVPHIDYPGTRVHASLRIVANPVEAASVFSSSIERRTPWCDITAQLATEKRRLEALGADAWKALTLLRRALGAHDILVNDQSILNYWASAFYPVYEPHTFLYPYGSGTLGYGLPAALGAACAARRSGNTHKIVCVSGDGGFQYTLHELATLAQYELPVKILLVNDEAYGIIGFLQRTAFGQTHEVALKNPDFCRLAESYGIRAERATTFAELEQKCSGWLNHPGPALLEWRTVLKSPWESGAIPRPTGIAMKENR
ncbi:MAG TPA: thiamine pyrophosphate-binding protein [Candidatus Limnocylindrales bacterium]|nr:thiamine pyrophosphate-binding protein [Candidatus Limnocylindrales bacterium]